MKISVFLSIRFPSTGLMTFWMIASWSFFWSAFFLCCAETTTAWTLIGFLSWYSTVTCVLPSGCNAEMIFLRLTSASFFDKLFARTKGSGRYWSVSDVAYPYMMPWSQAPPLFTPTAISGDWWWSRLMILHVFPLKHFSSLSYHISTIFFLRIFSTFIFALLVISQATTRVLSVTSISHATLLIGSCARQASKIRSASWSQILSGCPGRTDSQVMKCFIVQTTRK